MKLQIYNKILDPKIWNEDLTIKPEIREHLLKIAEDFYNSTGLKGEIHNILFLGSSANYNWTPASDMDLHIVIDIASESINEEYARKFMDSLAFKWNTEHDIEVKGHPVEVYLQDVREPNSTVKTARKETAIYSIFDGEWLIKPKHNSPHVDADKIRQKFKTIETKVQNLIDTRDIEKLKELMKAIRNYRDAGLHENGEFSVENLVFKVLRRSGVLGKIKNTINSVYDKAVSLPENGNMQPSTKTPEFPLQERIRKDSEDEEKPKKPMKPIKVPKVDKSGYKVYGYLAFFKEQPMFNMELWFNGIFYSGMSFAVENNHIIPTSLMGSVAGSVKQLVGIHGKVKDLFTDILKGISYENVKHTSYKHKKLLYTVTKEK